VQDNKERVVSYASRGLSDPEKNYPISELECLGIVWAVDYYYPYLYGRKFTIITDHSVLRFFKSYKNFRGRLARWFLKLQELDYEIKYRPGKFAGNVDCLSRLFEPLEEEEKRTKLIEPTEGEVKNVMMIMRSALSPSDIRYAQDTDKKVSLMKRYVQVKDKPLPHDPEMKKLINKVMNDLIVDDGILYIQKGPESKYFDRQLVVPDSLKVHILQIHHDEAGHLNAQKLVEQIKKKYFWQGMDRDIREYSVTCLECQASKTGSVTRAGLLEPIRVTTPFEKVGMDFVGPLPSTSKGNKYLLVFIDYMTRWPEAFAVPDRKASTVARIIVDELIPRFGPMKELLSDQAQEFKSELMEEVCRLMRIKKIFTSTYHPQTDGLCENFNKTLIHMLRHYVNEHQTDWDEFLPMVLFAYRTSIHHSTKESPFFLMYGRESLLPDEIQLNIQTKRVKSIREYADQLVKRLNEAYALVNKHMDRVKAEQKAYFDKHHREVQYQRGERVWLYTPRVDEVGNKLKLSKCWRGPFQIAEKISNNTYIIETVTGRKVTQRIHVERLKPYVGRMHPKILPSIDANDLFELDQEPEALHDNLLKQEDRKLGTNLDEQDYPVEKIVDERIRHKEKQFLVKWLGYGDECNSWVNQKDCHCDDLIKEYYHNH
jgi:transposase InsO family protein